MVLLKELVNQAKIKHGYYKPAQRSISKKTLEGNTGFYGVNRRNSKQYVQGYTYVYEAYDEDYNVLCYSSVDFLKLKARVQDNNLTWKVTDRSKALKTSRDVGLPLYDLI